MRLIRNLFLFNALALAATLNVQAAVKTWDGGGGDTNWMTPANWDGPDSAPVANDSLVFEGAVQVTNVNNFAAGIQFNGIRWGSTAGTFSSTGNSINLAGDLINDRANVAGVTIATPFALQQNIIANSTVSTGLLTVNGAITGAFSVTKNGPGIVAFGSSGNSFSGGLNINSGVMRTQVSGNTTTSLGTNTITIDNATLELRSTTATTFNNALVVNAGGANIDARVSHNFNPASISGAGTLSLRATGADNNVFTSGDMKGGPGGWTGNVIIDKNGRANFGLRFDNTYAGNSMLNIGVTLNDSTAITKRNGTNNAGTTVFDIGALSSSVTTSTIGGAAAGNGYFVWSIGNRNLNTTYTGTIIGGAVGSGTTGTALTKVGSGSLTLTGANTYAHGTTINGGTLFVSNTTGSGTGSGAVVVNSGGTLAGTGFIVPTGANSVTINAGGSLAPGASIGKLTFTLGSGSLDLSGISDGTGALKFELNTPTTDGTGSDIVTITAGTLNIGVLDYADFTFTPGGSFGPGTYTLFDAAASITGSIGSGSGTLAGYAANLVLDNGSAFDVKLVVSAAVPEASAFLFGGFVCCASLAGYVYRRRAIARH